LTLLAQSYKRLGELQEQRGDREKAIEYYGKFVELWKDADAELQPVVQDVKQRMSKLAGEGGPR
jgi:tetratricopeptide (TPR) repeat protein